MQKRKLQKNDIIHTVEDRTFRILEAIAEGGFCVIYQAEEVVGEESRLVLLKAYCQDPAVADQGEWESRIRHELQINRKIAKSSFSGALTMDYIVHEQLAGQVYGVMSADHPGKTLRAYVESDEFRYRTLRDRMVMGKRLFQLVFNFHQKCEIIHGDIHPENVYLLDTDNDGVYEKNAVFALLDFGISQEMEDEDHTVLGYTAGYAKADILNGSRTRLTVADDWYAVLLCFWYCFTGKSAADYPITRENIAQMHKQLSVRYESTSLVEEAERELLKLHEEQHQVVGNLLEELFLNLETLSEDAIELVKRILEILDDTGISKERLFSNLLEEYQSLRSTRFAGLDIVRRILPNAGFEMGKGMSRFARQKNSHPETLQQIMRRSKESLFLVGDGGMGKTTSLIQIMDDTYGDEIKVGNPVIFLELCTLSQHYEEWYSQELGGTFIEQFIASYFTKEPRTYVPANHPCVSALKEELFRRPKKGCQYTILLDGLNEIGFLNDKSRKVFFETLNHYLRHAKNLRIILTGRADTYELDPERLIRLHTEGLDDVHIEEILLEAVENRSLSESDCQRIVKNRHEISCSEYRLWQCLRIPFFLMMYCMMSQKQSVTRQGEILKNFFHDKRETLDGKEVYGQKQQIHKKLREKKYGDVNALRMDLSIRVVLDFIIPEIACRMVMDNLFFIELSKVKEVIREYLEPDTMKSTYQNWKKWYYGYEIDVQSVLEEIRLCDSGEAVPQYACDVLGIMRKTANGTLFFTHQYFRDYFAACAYINRILQLLEVRGAFVTEVSAGSNLFEDLLYPFQERKLSPYIAALIGEILGECRNLPIYDTQSGTWAVPDTTGPEQMVLSQFLDCYRILPEKEWTYASAMGLSNLFAILKSSRVQNDGRVDLSGLSFRNLELQYISLAGVVLSRFNRNGEATFAADFSGSTGVLDAFLQEDAITQVRCLAVHPVKKQILLQDRIHGTVTEVDLEHGESTVICDHMESVRFAAYCQKTEEILLVTYLSGSFEDRPKKGLWKRLASFAGIEDEDDAYGADYFQDEESFDYNDYDPRIFAEEDSWQEETRIYAYHRGRGLQLTARLEAEEPAAIQWSEVYQELSMMLCDVVGELSLVRGCFSQKEHPPMLSSSTIERVTFDSANLRRKEQGLTSFAFDRIDENTYVFTDFKEWKGDVGVWDSKTGQMYSLCYKDREKEKNLQAAICGSNVNGMVYGLEWDPGAYEASGAFSGKRIYKPVPYQREELCGYPIQTTFSLHVYEGNRMEILEGQLFLCLADHKLQLKALDGGAGGWISKLSVLSYKRSLAGYLIATCEDGLYEINVCDGSTTCIQKFTKSTISYVIGQSNRENVVVLLESTGIVKWLDIHTGCCKRHVTLQCPKITPDFKIYADDKKGILIAVSDRRVYLWESYSGALLRSYTVELPEGEILVSAEILDGDLVCYFEHRNFNSFPLERLYDCKIWNIEKGEWESSELPPFLAKKWKEPFRLYMSEDGLSYAFESLEEKGSAEEKTFGNPKKKGILEAFWDSVRVEDDYEEYDFGERVAPSGTDAWLQGKKRTIRYQSGKGHLRNIDVLEADEILLGLTSQGVMYLKEDTQGKGKDIYITNGYRQMQYSFSDLEGAISNAFTVNDTLVLQVTDESNIRTRILFWNLHDTTIYGYNATEKLVITGCKVIEEPEPQPKNRKMLLKMQGIGEPVRHILGRIRSIEEEQEIMLKHWKERIRSWNYLALGLALLMCVISAIVVFGTDALEGAEEYRGIHYQGIFVQRLVKYLLMLLSMKCLLPYLIKWLKREWFFGIRGILVIAIFSAAVVTLLYPWRWRLLVRMDLLLFLWIPFTVWFSQNRPKHKERWILVMLVPVLAFLWSVRRLDWYYSTTYLVHMVATAVVAVLLSELLRNKLAFRRGMIKVFIGFLSGVGVLWIALERKDIVVWPVAYVERKFSHLFYWWEGLKHHCRQVLLNAKVVGKADIDKAIHLTGQTSWDWDYLERYFINYLIQDHGLLFGIVAAILSVAFVWALITGARKQRCKLDRGICMVCALYFVIQIMISLPASFGLQWIPPYETAFLGLFASLWHTDVLALGVYMAFYDAHKQMR